ncbi:hypothetical protein JCM33374_g3152 [Metschnikowia sp. JCM 33374]|nr:hypothetical protein JCM33374_g3152 [Metschnikowia sp. JCM 33374]
MTRGNVKESNSAQIQRNGVGPESVPGHDNARRNTALQRMIDIKKSYDFWQELVNKNMRSKLKQKKISDADAGENSASHVGEEDDDFFDSEMTVESQEFFSEQDLQFLRKRLDEIVSQNGIQLKDGEVDRLLESCVVEAKINQGFDPYGNEDEEGLHDGNSGEQDEELPAQDDYNVEELQDEETFSYEYPTRHHHFEVELSDRPPGSGPPDDNEASCEFTFEYDRDGKLIPTSNNIEEKLRLMNLQSQITNEALSSASASAMAIASAAGGKKKKKHQKRRRRRRRPMTIMAIVRDKTRICAYSVSMRRSMA